MRAPYIKGHKKIQVLSDGRWFCRVCQSARQKTLRKEKKNAVR